MQWDVQTDARTITTEDLANLLKPTPGPCVSIYVNASPAEGADQGRIRFNDALKRAERSLDEHVAPGNPGQTGGFLEPLRRLIDDDLWLSIGPGLAAFLSHDALYVRRLPEPLPDLVVVADSFHVKPLIRLVQGGGRYQVLAVSNEQVALYEGDRHHLTEVALHPEVPKNMAEAIGEPARVTDPKRAPWEPDDSDTRDRQLMRYFRRLDDAVWEHHSRPSGLPLILAALPEYHTFFHEASRNPQLSKEAAIKRDVFHGIGREEIHRLACEAMRPIWERQVAELRDRFGNARPHGRGSDDLQAIAEQAAFGKVATLMIEENKHIGGAIDPGTGRITFKDLANAQTDDALDDLAELVLRNRGEVLVLPDEMMPTDHGVAAIYRY